MGLRASIVAISFLSGFFWLAFFWLAPFFGFPLDWTVDEPQRFIEIIFPVFFGFLVTASQYVVNPVDIKIPTGEKGVLIRMLLFGGFGTFYALMIVLCVIFAIGHRAEEAESYLSLSQFSAGVAVSVGILTGVVATLVGYVFGAKSDDKNVVSDSGNSD